MEPYRTEKVETEAGEYTIELHYDSDVDNPLTDWDHSGMAFWVNYRSNRYIETDTLNEADDKAANALRSWVNAGYSEDDVIRHYAKWRVITGSSWMLVSGSDSASQSDFYRWYVLVDTAATYTGSDGNEYLTLPEPLKAVASTMEAYRKWAAGEFVGYVVTGPDGADVDSLGGIDDEDYALSEAKDNIAGDVEQRVAAAALAAEQASSSASLVGSGFVGLI